MSQSSSKPLRLPLKTIFFIFLIVALLIVLYSIIEQNQSKKEMLLLMNDQAHSLLETTLTASEASLLSYEEIDNVVKSRLLNNANFIKILLEQNRISNELLESIAKTNNIYRINIFNKNGEKTFTNHQPIHTDLAPKFTPKDFLAPILEGEVDTLFLGIKQARFEDGNRFAVVVATKNRDAIVLNLDAKELLEFRKKIGFGALLKSVTNNNSITYAILQDSNGIIAASGKFSNISQISNDKFLSNIYKTLNFNTRLIINDSTSILEAVHPFRYRDEVIGILRLGLPAEALTQLTNRSENRMWLTGLVLLLLGSILLAYVFTKQNFEHLKKDYKIIEDYSQKIISNVSDCIIVFDNNRIIKTFNTASEILFKKSQDAAIGEKLDVLFNTNNMDLILKSGSNVTPISVSIDDENKYLLFSKNQFAILEDEKDTILVLRDISKIKSFEERLQRKERLVAMGELASGVAHEIRNPLNTISTITQQLAKDFEPVNNAEEYFELANLVHKEVKRINNTIKDFLRFAKPEEIKLDSFNLSELIVQIEQQYKSMFNEKNIDFKTVVNWEGNVNWDRNKIQQVIMNLLQNSYDSIDSNGLVTLILDVSKNIAKISIEDTGSGIPDEMKNKIFNLYYTSKSNGTGIGLSIVQRIIYEHNGIIHLESEIEKGTKFIISIPINPLMV